MRLIISAVADISLIFALNLSRIGIGVPAGAGAGIGIVVSGAVQAMGRNPDFAGTIQTNMILGIAFAESIAIYCLVIALLILFVGV